MPIEHLQTRWHFHRRMNKKVWININRLRSIALAASSKQDILDGMHPWRLSISLRYNNTFSFILIGLGLIIIVTATIYLYQAGLLLLLLWIVGIVIACYGYLSLDKQSEVDTVVHLLSHIVFRYQYQLKFSEFPELPYEQVMNPHYLLTKIRQGFPCLNEGNSRNEISEFASTYWHVDGDDYPILLFHYIATTEIVLTNNKGDEIRQSVDSHRWGACVFQMPALGLVVSSERQNYQRYPVIWNSSDIAFNQRFCLYGQQQIELAKNLTPQRILALANHLQHMKGTLIFHEEMPIFCYVSTQNIFEYDSPKKEIKDVSQLRGYLRTLQSRHYLQMMNSLTAIIRSFKDESLLESNKTAN